METKTKKAISTGLWAIGAILLGFIIVSWFVDYPKWLDQLLSNILLTGLGLVMFYKAYQIRKKDPKFATIYLIIGAALILVALLSFTFIKIIAVIGLVIFILTNPRVRKIINKQEEKQNP